MDKVDLKNFKELYNKFLDDCNRVAGILANSKERTVHESGNINYADTFRLEDDDVYWEGVYDGHKGFASKNLIIESKLD